MRKQKALIILMEIYRLPTAKKKNEAERLEM
jgi:hypothetical protein